MSSSQQESTQKTAMKKTSGAAGSGKVTSIISMFEKNTNDTVGQKIQSASRRVSYKINAALLQNAAQNATELSRKSSNQNIQPLNLASVAPHLQTGSNGLPLTTPRTAALLNLLETERKSFLDIKKKFETKSLQQPNAQGNVMLNLKKREGTQSMPQPLTPEQVNSAMGLLGGNKISKKIQDRWKKLIERRSSPVSSPKTDVFLNSSQGQESQVSTNSNTAAQEQLKRQQEEYEQEQKELQSIAKQVRREQQRRNHRGSRGHGTSEDTESDTTSAYSTPSNSLSPSHSSDSLGDQHDFDEESFLDNVRTVLQFPPPPILSALGISLEDVRDDFEEVEPNDEDLLMYYGAANGGAEYSSVNINELDLLYAYRLKSIVFSRRFRNCSILNPFLDPIVEEYNGNGAQENSPSQLGDADLDATVFANYDEASFESWNSQMENEILNKRNSGSISA